MIKKSQVGVMPRCSAISNLAPLGSVEKYSVNVMFTFSCFLYTSSWICTFFVIFYAYKLLVMTNRSRSTAPRLRPHGWGLTQTGANHCLGSCIHRSQRQSPCVLVLAVRSHKAVGSTFLHLHKEKSYGANPHYALPTK